MSFSKSSHVVRAADAIAKDRAGRFSVPPPRAERPRHVDDRPDVSVYSASTFSCSQCLRPFVLILLAWFVNREHTD